MNGGGEVTGGEEEQLQGSAAAPETDGLSACADRWPASLLISAFNALDKRLAGAGGSGSEEVAKPLLRQQHLRLRAARTRANTSTVAFLRFIFT